MWVFCAHDTAVARNSIHLYLLSFEQGLTVFSALFSLLMPFSTYRNADGQRDGNGQNASTGGPQKTNVYSSYTDA